VSVRDVLVKARALIATPEKWTKGALARDAGGIGYRTDDVVGDRTFACYCAEGACVAATPEIFLARRAYDELCKFTNGPLVYEFNDSPATTHDDVLALFDTAIANCEAT
jgi:hypothetical protein